MSLRKPLPQHRWKQIETLFLRALDFPDEARARFIEAECAADPELGGEVLSLLGCGDREIPELMGALEAGAASVIHQESFSGSRLGAYRVERELGRGGMAVVYLGARADGQFEQRVAIKLIKRGMDTAAVIERLRRERRILGSLNHPSIAHLLDGGSTPEGLPYLVMEHVEGLAIDRFCEQHQLTIAARCQLLAKVCDAVSYAHRKLVVHRDLKPANILITADGSPKLLDFGLAKILNADFDGDATVNAPHARPLTPGYASPEQIRGEELTTATDVYSLGVILYELLARVRPFRVESASEYWSRMICETGPPRPSAAAEGALRRALTGDLDNIVLKAMHKDAERRYASAGELAADLRRYLESKPVLARKDSFAYRAAKFARRQKFTLLAAAAVMASLMTGMLIAISQAHRADAARIVAEVRRQEAEKARATAEREHARAEQQRDAAVENERRAQERLSQLVDLSDRSLSDVYARVERLPGAVPARQALIASTLGLLEKLSRDSSSNPSLRFALEKAYLRLGDLQGGPDSVSMGDQAAAIRSYQAGLALFQETPTLATPCEQAITWVDLRWKLGRLVGFHHLAPGVDLLHQTIAVSSRLHCDPPADVALARSRATLLLSLSRISHLDLERSKGYALEYLNAVKALRSAHPRDAQARYDVSVADVELGYILKALGDPEAAARYYLDAVQAREQLVKEFPNDSMYRITLALIYRHVGALEGGPDEPNLGNRELARVYYGKARPIAEASLADPLDRDALASYAGFLLESGGMETDPRELPAALDSLRRAAAIFESLPGAPLAPASAGLVSAYQFIGRDLLTLEDHDGALKAYRQSQAFAENILADRPDRVVLGQWLEDEAGISRVFAARGDRAAALDHAARFMQTLTQKIKRAESAEDRSFIDSWTAQADLLLAGVHRSFGEWSAAQQAAQRALQEAQPLATGRRWDRNTIAVRQAQILIDECRKADGNSPFDRGSLQ